MADTTKAGPRPCGLLLAMMEPPASAEAEFQDWYDSEHFPERQNAQGFLTAGRYVCLDGWPRYLALYDLADTDVLNGPSYAAIARDRYSVWTRRMVPQVWGNYRAEGQQIYPGNALMGENGQGTRLVLWRFGKVPDVARGAILDGLRAHFESLPTLLQLRTFASRQAEGIDYIALAELSAPTCVTPAQSRRIRRHAPIP